MGVTCSMTDDEERIKEREREEVMFSIFLSFDGLLVGRLFARFGAVVFGRLLEASNTVMESDLPAPSSEMICRFCIRGVACTRLF